ncbi:hypothetical protein [Terricaulis silvestris]|uniref:Uncharacterized protein n=1 Tax=Terricaulis silvestris TaxID=2686094 RepID=A0A6I6MFR6_9CAUL|nr:hypothetical protein [Terricaulis silvestris]QGZ93365.1 hypothetical protein DSM104635_00175 [Terricaulis silvestris]
MNDPLNALRARRAEIERAIERLSAEDSELAVTERVLARFSIDKVVGVSHQVRQPRPRSQREFVLEALGRSETAWLRSAEIVALIQTTWGEVIPELSVRPLLTSLKRASQIVRQGRLVALKARAHEPMRSGGRQRVRLRRS